MRQPTGAGSKPCAGGDPVDSEAETTAVRDCLEQLWAAYKRGDPRAIAELYHSNANLVGGQEVAVGRAAIEQQYTRLLALDPARPDTTVNSNLRIHLVRSDLAIVDAAATLTRADGRGNEEKLGNAYFTIVLTKDQGRWRLAALRGAEAANLAAP
jgi:uncharacterized protein (TIGR02246 family)